MIAATLNCPPESLVPESRLGEHQAWDSFGQLNIMLALEQEFGIEINDETIRRFSAFGEILNLATPPQPSRPF